MLLSPDFVGHGIVNVKHNFILLSHRLGEMKIINSKNRN